MSTSIDVTPIARSLDALSRNIQTVNNNLEVVHEQVIIVAQEQNDTRQVLDELFAKFNEFVIADTRAKELQLATSNITQVRQELEKRFGHYDVVRRTIRGILHETDVALVRQDTIRTATENIMLAAPNYWLAAALVALAAWMADNRPLAERALGVAIDRDDSKTSLLFALIARRARRSQALALWLARYFQNQNPAEMDREVVVMIDALANGLFGPASLTACSEVVNQWLVELEEKAGFADEQRRRWAAALGVLAPDGKPGEYPTLRKHSPTWPLLDASLSAARRNQQILTHFGQIFAGEIVVSPRLEENIDNILESLVKNFDDEELPLRRKEHLLSLIVEEQGDRVRATQRYDAVSGALDDRQDFAALLTNSAMNPQQFGATRATQRYAIALSRRWVIQAYLDLVTRDRLHMASAVEVTCGSWRGTVNVGTTEQALAASLKRHYDERIEQAVNAVQVPPLAWIAVVGAGLFAVFCIAVLPWAVGILIGGGAAAIACAYCYNQYSILDKRKAAAREALERESAQALQVLRACIAELTDLGREIATEDAKAANVSAFLESLNSPQFILGGPDRQRTPLA